MSGKPEWVPLAKEEFEERELITTILFSNGNQQEIRMPLMDDVLPYMGTNEFTVMLACIATNMTRRDYGRLSFVDGLAIMQPLNQYVESIQKYNAPDKKQKK